MTPPDFARRAPKYDRLRPVDENWWRVFDVLAREGDLHGRRIVDIGCGTGRLAAALVERAHARVWAVDAAPAMVEQARSNVPPSVGVKLGRAEALPFRDGWFERALMWLAIHLVDRRQALAEARRVLAPGGRLAIVTFDAAHFGDYWLTPYFPSLEAVDRARFPTREELGAELLEARFAEPRFVRLEHEASLTRAEALDRIEGAHISTFDILPPDELATGLERARRELPEYVAYTLQWLLAFADTRS